MAAYVHRARRLPQNQRGASLVETMVALVVGLAITSAALSNYMGNRTAYKQIEGLARLQETARIAAALLESDIRQADGSLCRRNLPFTNATANNNWWAQPANGVQGFDSTVADGRASGISRQAGTDSITVWSANANRVVQVRAAASAGNGTTFTVDRVANLAAGSLAAVCNYDAEVLFTVSAASGTTVSTSSAVNGFGPGSLITALEANHWYIGQKTAISNGSLNNLALRRTTLGSNGSTTSDEIVENVSDMQITYLAGDVNGRPTAASYVDATQIINWSQVLAARITLTLRSPEVIAVGAAGAASAATYQVPITAAIRSRLP
jgi:type IV pilus assembly protein PilW